MIRFWCIWYHTLWSSTMDAYVRQSRFSFNIHREFSPLREPIFYLASPKVIIIPTYIPLKFYRFGCIFWLRDDVIMGDNLYPLLIATSLLGQKRGGYSYPPPLVFKESPKGIEIKS